jgi:heat shock protein HslJ
MRKLIAARTAAVTVALLALCSYGCSQKESPPPAAAAPAGPPPVPTADQLRAATVSGVFEQAVTLADGVYHGAPAEAGAAAHPMLTLWEPAIAFGDVDGAAGNEAVALLSSTTGGSGEFVHVAVFGVRDGALANLGTAPVGDRVRLQNLWLQQGKIIMDVVEAGPKDAACCPTQLARKTYAMEGGTLKQSSSEVLGTLSAGTLAAVEWQLAEIDGQRLAEGVKAPVIHFEHESLRGFGGCNRFTARITETAPGEIDIGPAAATKMACPEPQMALEARFFSQLEAVERYTFVAGQLALTWQDKDRPGTLLFSK